MSSFKPSKTDDNNNQLSVKKENIPVNITDLSIFDNAVVLMKERFAEEMRRIDQQMQRFSKDLTLFYGQSTSMESGPGSTNRDDAHSTWDVLTSSPLVESAGDDKIIKLQFDVSEFEPEEVTVKLLNNILIVSASHEEKKNDSSIYREYNREFMLPPGTDSEQVVSTLSKEGVLTVTAPLPIPSGMIYMNEEK